MNSNDYMGNKTMVMLWATRLRESLRSPKKKKKKERKKKAIDAVSPLALTEEEKQ
jgi:hypothetical protein